VAATLGVFQVLCLVLPGDSQVDVGLWERSFVASWLPDEVRGWSRTAHRIEHRDRSSDEGQRSRIWLYRRQDRTAQFSVDFPFLGWHDLTRCYLSHGWLEVQCTTLHPGDDESELGPFVQVELRRTNGSRGLLLFSMYDGQGRSVLPRVGHWCEVRAKLSRNPVLSFLARGGPAVAAEQPTLQMQQFITGSSPPSEADKREAHALYLELRRELHARWLKSNDREAGQ
jgi:hypothetical protein